MGRWFFIIIAFNFCVAIIQSNPPSCTTPNGETTQCISLFSCPILQDAIGLKDESLYKFIKASSCGSSGNEQFMVCCGRFANFTDQITPNLENKNPESKNTTNELHRDFVIKKLLPSTIYCGLQHTDDYFYNQTATSIDEFPWILYIPLRTRYPNGEGVELKCSGVLLNRRYALTTAQCAVHLISTVRIGQYNKLQNVSCITTSFGEDDCTEPVVEVQVVARYQPSNSNLLLLRLAEKVTYTDYIRPICLPLRESDRPQLGETVVTSGWGEADYKGKLVKIKKRIKHVIVSNKMCSPRQMPFICATTLKNSTDYVCDGDDGGPVMYKRGNNWFVGGLVSSSIECYTNKPFPAEEITSEVLELIFEQMYLDHNL